MSHPTEDTPTPANTAAPSAELDAALPVASSPADPPVAEVPAADGIEVEEMDPAGGPSEAPLEPAPAPGIPPSEHAAPKVQSEKGKVGRDTKAKPAAAGSAVVTPAVAAVAVSSPVLADDDEEVPILVWYVLKVQSSREDTIRDALERRVKIQGLQRFFGRIVVPTEKTTEIRNNKKRIVERKTYPGYIMVEMELNEKTWFVVRETPGVGDFVGAHGTPTKMTETEVNQMLGQETAKAEDAPRVRIDVERGDRVKIKDGPFENFEGSVEEVIEARGLVKVMLIIFNRPTPVDLEYWQVERI